MRPDSARTTLALAFVAILLVGCDARLPAEARPPDSTLTPVAQTQEWPASTPAAEGGDAARLSRLVGEIRAGSHGETMRSLLIARNGRLIVEEYFNGWSSEAAHTMQSVTKSVTSLAVGLAIDRGHLRLSDRLTSLFPDYQPVAAMDANKEALTVRHALMMQSGFDWNEQTYTGSPLQQMNNCRCDWIRFMLDRAMREPPGARWEYISGSTILLGAAVGTAANQRIDRFLAQHLFDPMGFRGVRWESGLPDGLPHTGGGLYLRPRDMIKIGQLAIAGGVWQGRQLVARSWIDDSTAAHLSLPRTLAGRPAAYGYLWWRLPDGVITASGAQGQWILGVPALNLVVVSNASGGGAEAVQFFYNQILPAVQR